MGEVHDIHEARNQGHKIVNKLKHACLLESCDSKEQRVKMHDVIYDMVLWLYCECGKEKNKILVYNDVCRLTEAQEILELKETKKMSLWDLDPCMFYIIVEISFIIPLSFISIFYVKFPFCELKDPCFKFF